jgi:hypothetical protein
VLSPHRILILGSDHIGCSTHRLVLSPAFTDDEASQMSSLVTEGWRIESGNFSKPLCMLRGDCAHVLTQQFVVSYVWGPADGENT